MKWKFRTRNKERILCALADYWAPCVQLVPGKGKWDHNLNVISTETVPADCYSLTEFMAMLHLLSVNKCKWSHLVKTMPWERCYSYTMMSGYAFPLCGHASYLLFFNLLPFCQMFVHSFLLRMSIRNNVQWFHWQKIGKAVKLRHPFEQSDEIYTELLF